MPSDTRPVETHELYLGEAALVYCASFEDDPAVTGGATIVSASVLVENAKITAGAAQVITSEFVQYDRDGVTELASVPAGKGVSVALTPTAKGSCEVTVRAVCSDGQTPAVKARFTVK